MTGLDPLVLHFLVALAAIWPLFRIARRAGLHPAWAGLVFVPIAGWPAIATVLALRPWPTRPADLWRAPKPAKRRKAGV